MVVTANAVNTAFKLVAALVFMPVMYGIGRQIRMPEAAKYFMIGVIALIGSFALSVIGQQTGLNAEWFRWLRHLVVAFAGFSLAWAAWQARQHELSLAGGHR
jgi:hypothetical protein